MITRVEERTGARTWRLLGYFSQTTLVEDLKTRYKPEDLRFTSVAVSDATDYDSFRLEQFIEQSADPAAIRRVLQKNAQNSAPAPTPAVAETQNPVDVEW